MFYHRYPRPITDSSTKLKKIDSHYKKNETNVQEFSPDGVISTFFLSVCPVVRQGLDFFPAK